MSFQIKYKSKPSISAVKEADGVSVNFSGTPAEVLTLATMMIYGISKNLGFSIDETMTALKIGLSDISEEDEKE